MNLENFLIYLFLSFSFSFVSAQGQWTSIHYDEDKHYYDYDFWDPDHGIISLNYLTQRTTDGGTSWLPVNFDCANSYVKYLNQQIIYAGGNHKICKSTDGGQNWSNLITFPDTGGIDVLALHLVGDSVIFAYIGPKTGNGPSSRRLERSLDAGLTWQSIPVSVEFPWSLALLRTGFAFFDALHGFGIDPNNNELLETTDGGLSWTTVYAGLEYHSLQLINDSTLAVGLDVISTDRGQSWDTLSGFPASGHILWLDEDRLIAQTCSTGAYVWISDNLYSDDRGQSWRAIWEQPSTPSCWGGAIAFSDTALVVMGYYSFSLYTASNLLVWRGDHLVSSPESQTEGWMVGPNPAAHFLNISGGTHQSECELTLYDLRGVMQRQRRFKAPGLQFQERMDLEGLAPGIYILRMQDGEHIWTQKVWVTRP